MTDSYKPGFLADMNTVEYTNELAAAKTPVGGGSAAGMTLALAVGSAAKVAAIMSARDVQSSDLDWDALVDEINDLRYHALVLAEDDTRALLALKKLWTKAGSSFSQEERLLLLSEAMVPAKKIIEIAELAANILDTKLYQGASKIVLSDVGVAAALLSASAKAALLNIQINHGLLMKELGEDKKMDAELDFNVYVSSVERISEIAAHILHAVQECL